MKHGSCRWSRSEGKGTIQCVGKRLDSLLCERLELEREVCSADQSFRTEGGFYGIDGGVRSSHEQTPDLVCKVRHF